MKKYYLLLTLVSCLFSSAQNVGINTNIPSAQLDINGNAMIRTVPDAPLNNSYDFLVIDPETEEVKKVNGNFNRNTTIAKAKQINNISLLTLGNSTGWKKIKFGTPSIDLGSNFTITNLDHYYTVPSSGIYEIFYYFKYGSGVNATLLGTIKAGIFKNADSAPLNAKGFSGATIGEVVIVPAIGVLPAIKVAVDITISSTSIKSAYKLETGDKISFQINNGGGVTLSLLSSSAVEVVIKKISD